MVRFLAQAAAAWRYSKSAAVGTFAAVVTVASMKSVRVQFEAVRNPLKFACCLCEARAGEPCVDLVTRKTRPAHVVRCRMGQHDLESISTARMSGAFGENGQKK